MTEREIEAKRLLLKTMDWFNAWSPGDLGANPDELLRDIATWFREWRIKDG